MLDPPSTDGHDLQAGRQARPSPLPPPSVCFWWGSQSGREGLCRPHPPRVSPCAGPRPSPLPRPHELIRSLQLPLKHLFCIPPAVLGPWGSGASLRISVSAFAVFVRLRVSPVSCGPQDVARPVWGPVVSAAPPRCLALVGCHVCSLDRKMREGRCECPGAAVTPVQRPEV